MVGKYKLAVCCGSLRFQKEFKQVEDELTLQGYIVLYSGQNLHTEKNSNETLNIDLDNMQLAKIKVADLVYIIDKGGYIGESTRAQLDYAKTLEKEIRFYSENTHKKTSMTVICIESMAGVNYTGKCPRCGEVLHTGFMDSNFCHWCGQELDEGI